MESYKFAYRNNYNPEFARITSDSLALEGVNDNSEVNVYVDESMRRVLKFANA